MKYNLNMMQRLSMPLRYLLWATMPKDQRKSWHEVKKGMEPHEHKFTVPRPGGLLRCEHEGCNLCEDPNFDAMIEATRREVECIIARSRV